MRNRAPRNRTLSCTDQELVRLSHDVMRVAAPVTRREIEGQVLQADILSLADYLPTSFVDLLILDPPYNLSKNFNGTRFHKKRGDEYQTWFEQIIDSLIPMMKPYSTVYVCSDWKTSTLVYPVLKSRFFVRNRITWEREKGRGSKMNWKNNTEDIWFCTVADKYYFDVEEVKLKRRVLAPYKVDGHPKDWSREEHGNYRLTFPSNIWTDMTVPFWSMPENTDHPTQKPEKLIAKLILASSKIGAFVFDPFVGSGTTAVVAEKLMRRWCGVDINKEFLCWTLKRLDNARRDPSIQGYRKGVFWERNSRPRKQSGAGSYSEQRSLFS